MVIRDLFRKIGTSNIRASNDRSSIAVLLADYDLVVIITNHIVLYCCFGSLTWPLGPGGSVGIEAQVPQQVTLVISGAVPPHVQLQPRAQLS